MVKCTIYSADTPVSVARCIAGQHQSSQHDVRESTMADCLSFIIDIAKQKDRDFGSPMLQDEEVFDTLVNFGAIRGSEKALSKTAATMSLRDATNITKSQVCTRISAYELIIFFSYRRPTLSHCGGTSSRWHVPTYTSSRSWLIRLVRSTGIPRKVKCSNTNCCVNRPVY